MASLKESESRLRSYDSPVPIPFFLKLMGTFLIFGFIPFAVMAVLLIVGYESLINELIVQLSAYLEKEALTGVLAILEDIRIQAALTLFGLLALLFLGSIVLGRVFTEPFVELMRGVEKVSSGDLSVAIPVRTRDEVGLLSRRFNEMVEHLREVRSREELISRAKSEFISIVAHQLRTPLSAVKWTLRLVLDEDVGKIAPEQSALLQQGYEANERMIRLVSDLLDVTRIEEGRFGHSPKSSDITPVIKQAIDDIQPLARKRNIGINIVLPEETPPPVLIDKERIAIAVSNILSNAVNYTLPGGLVVLRVRVHSGDIEISVSDNGVGIPDSQTDRLFTKFFRGGNVVHMQTQGTGLGLFITKNIIESHGGRIWAKSEEGRGSTFFFTVPIKNKVTGAQPETKQQ